MLGIFYALITLLAWGTWLAPSQNVPFKNRRGDVDAGQLCAGDDRRSRVGEFEVGQKTAHLSD